jgi:hypothetical protein
MPPKFRTVFIKLWSAVVRRRFRMKGHCKHCQKLNERKNPIHICAKTAFVGWTSAEIKRISYFHNLLSFNHYFRKCSKLLYIKNVVMITLTTGIMFLLFTCIRFWVWGILRRWSACVCRPPMKWSTTAKSLRNTGFEILFSMFWWNILYNTHQLQFLEQCN